ncbi:MAG: hypothetical protein ACRDA5_09295 [Clostridium sp.]
MSAIGIEKDNFEKICKAINSINLTLKNNKVSSDLKIEKIKCQVEVIEENL